MREQSTFRPRNGLGIKRLLPKLDFSCYVVLDKMSMKAVKVICVLAVVYSARAQFHLHVDYPEQGNYNLVTFNCSDTSGSRLRDVEFLRRAPGEDSRTPLQEGSPTDDEITITLTQEKEGYFSCRCRGSTSTNEIGLAG